MGSPKITFIGAGSSVFARALLKDLFLFPELQSATISLMDIDPDRLADSVTIAHREATLAGATPTIQSTTDRREALADADYVINMIQVGGYKPATVTDFEIARKFGVEQTIGDTLGIGGIMRSLRTIPVLLDMAWDMEEVCPDALLLNYSNPMATLMWALSIQSSINSVGLCHSVQGTAIEIAGFLGIPSEEVRYLCAGINHMAFYLSLERNGESLYPDLHDLQEANDFPAHETVRFTLLRDFGYFVTESSEHFSEYVPWFIKRDRPDLIEQYNVLLDEYPARCEDQIAEWATMRTAILGDDFAAYQKATASQLPGSNERKLALDALKHPDKIDSTRARLVTERTARKTGHSGEYGSLIIHSMETGQPRVIYGNVPNDTLISNLPADCIVELPCLVDDNGIQPTQIGEMPSQLTALMQTNINPQRLTVEAAILGDRDAVYQAALLDPHTAAVLSPDETRALVDALLDAHSEFLPQFEE